MKNREIETLLSHWTSVFIVAGLLVGCGSAQDTSDFEYVGTLGAVFVTSSMSGSATSQRLFLKASEYEYELRFQTSTDFTNIESKPAGEIWKPGSIYGVNGELNGTVLVVDVIAYIGPATTTQEATGEIAPVTDESNPESIESGSMPEVPAAPQMTDIERQKSQAKRLMSQQIAELRRSCKETDDYAARIEAGIEKWELEVARIEDTANNNASSGDELSLARARAGDARIALAEIRDDQARCREQLNVIDPNKD